VLQPKNGQAAVAASMPIELVVVSRSDTPISAVTAMVIGGGAPLALVIGDRVGEDGVKVRGELRGLDPTQDNWVQLQVTADRVYTRTLRLGPPRN
jgi:hypothetical protein